MVEPDRDFRRQTRDVLLIDDLQQLVRLAVREDLARGMDITTIAVVPNDLPSASQIVTRADGIAAGVELLPSILETIGTSVTVQAEVRDGDVIQRGDRLARLQGDAPRYADL